VGEIEKCLLEEGAVIDGMYVHKHTYIHVMYVICTYVFTVYWEIFEVK